jgi:hypothetical protein
MRIHAFSDLHLEFGALTLPDDVRSGELAELVLLAGDIDVKRRGPRWAATQFTQPVAIIAGNHEAYGDSLFAMISASRAAAEDASRGRAAAVRFLEREIWTTAARDGTPVRILGATLWTDFAAFGIDHRRRAMAFAHEGMSDFDRIRVRDPIDTYTRRLEPDDVLRLHESSRRFLDDALAEPFDGITIVVTHHAPSLRSVPIRWRNDPLTPAYASAVDALIERFQPALWLHGHLHESCNYAIGRTRVICNPRGYAPDELNPEFDPRLVIELQ